MTFQIGEKSIVINDQLIHYYYSQKNKQAVIFLHGWRCEVKIWLELFSQFENYSLFSLDLPGFGKSEMPKKIYSLDDYVFVVKEFITKLDIKNPIIIGHSFGGNIAIKLAVQNPKFLKVLVLIDSSGIRLKTAKKKLVNVIAKILRPIFSPLFMQSLRRLIYKKMGNEDYLETPALQQTFINIIQEDLTPKLNKIKQPTLIVWGENDKDTPLDQAYVLQKNIPNNKFIVLKNAGHFSFLDQKEKFIKHVLDFLAVNH